MNRYYVVFTGRVQGVGFRWTVQMLANKYGYTGWIRNMYNGNVEMCIQGRNLNIYEFINAINKSSRWISIDDFSIKPLEADLSERSFWVR